MDVSSEKITFYVLTIENEKYGRFCYKSFPTIDDVFNHLPILIQQLTYDDSDYIMALLDKNALTYLQRTVLNNKITDNEKLDLLNNIVLAPINTYNPHNAIQAWEACL